MKKEKKKEKRKKRKDALDGVVCSPPRTAHTSPGQAGHRARLCFLSLSLFILLFIACFLHSKVVITTKSGREQTNFFDLWLLA